MNNITITHSLAAALAAARSLADGELAAAPAGRSSAAAAAMAGPVPARRGGAGVESTAGRLRPGVEAAVRRAAGAGAGLGAARLELPGAPPAREGKVRDSYDVGAGRVVMVTTDRQSAFDRHLATIPFKGQVLNQTSAWWMGRTAGIVPNALLSVPHPCVSVMKKCEVLPVEVVARGFMTGSTDTSLWTHYRNGVRNYCGNAIPDGMRKNDRLAANILTPTTKAADHDVPIAPEDLLREGLMSEEQWAVVSEAALELFAFGQREALERGLILVDTKYEFGLDPDGTICLIDEIHTPDSSRYWLSSSYEARLGAGLEPENIDKEFLRLWYRDNCDPYNDATVPDAPVELVEELSRRYIYLYEQITGTDFAPAAPETLDLEYMERQIAEALAEL